MDTRSDKEVRTCVTKHNKKPWQSIERAHSTEAPQHGAARGHVAIHETQRPNTREAVTEPGKEEGGRAASAATSAGTPTAQRAQGATEASREGSHGHQGRHHGSGSHNQNPQE